jgi:hypothetical protein
MDTIHIKSESKPSSLPDTRDLQHVFVYFMSLQLYASVHWFTGML